MSSSKYVDKKSVFYGFVIPVNSEEMVNDMLKAYRKKYYDARHICYAYCLNADKSVMKSSDNGEPSGTAGRPMLGVLQSYNVTNVLLIAVRYFGGILLGVDNGDSADTDEYKGTTRRLFGGKMLLMIGAGIALIVRGRKMPDYAYSAF